MKVEREYFRAYARAKRCNELCGCGEQERRRAKEMAKVGDLAYKAFTAGLGAATLYLSFTFGVNVYRGLSWHTAQS
ncbi:hypothetical protein Taro_010654, partial [Colocasia esculenta]|nr:hypothetical protein [Colocasia esculenta]